jgi:hypothetical protein
MNSWFGKLQRGAFPSLIIGLGPFCQAWLLLTAFLLGRKLLNQAFRFWTSFM